MTDKTKAPPAQAEKTRTPPDPELKVLARLKRILDEIPERARTRVIEYLHDRYVNQPFDESDSDMDLPEIPE